MSYGIGVVILKDDLEKEKIKYDFCDWTLPITEKLYPKEAKKNIKRWYIEMQNLERFTSLEKLMNAPCDIVVIINKEGSLEYLKNRKPLPNIDIKKHLLL